MRRERRNALNQSAGHAAAPFICTGPGAFVSVRTATSIHTVCRLLQRIDWLLSRHMRRAYCRIWRLGAVKRRRLPIVRLFRSSWGRNPSLMSGETVERLLTGIRSRFRLTEDCEITMEANPGTAESEIQSLSCRRGESSFHRRAKFQRRETPALGADSYC